MIATFSRRNRKASKRYSPWTIFEKQEETKSYRKQETVKMTTAPGPFEDDPFPSVWSKWSQQIFPRRCLRPLRPVRALLLAIAFCCLLFLWLVRSTGEVRVLRIYSLRQKKSRMLTAIVSRQLLVPLPLPSSIPCLPRRRSDSPPKPDSHAK